MKKKNRNAAPRCPYCESPAILCSADGIYINNPKKAMLYVCKKYPLCDSYVRVHPGTNIPMGTLANGTLRRLRREAHKKFDQLHELGLMTKADAYQWLADLIAAPLSEAHIGLFGEYYCNKVIAESSKMLSKHTQHGTQM